MGQHSQAPKKKKRILYFDMLTIVACVCVIAMHCNNLVHAFEPTGAWNQALAIEVLAYWAVPVFFMLTGANNMGYRKKYDTKTFLLRRLRKLVIPFIFWSVFVYGLNCLLDPDVHLWFPDFWEGLLNSSIEASYWFFPAIISLTLAMPVLSLLADHRSTCWYVVICAFVLTFLLPPVCELANIPWSTGFLSLPVAGGYVAYALLGYLLATGEVERKWRICIYILAVASLALRYAFTLEASYAAGETVRTLFGYTNFIAVFPSVAIFLLFKYIKWPAFLENHSTGVATISGCAFGIYLIHRLLIRGAMFHFGFIWQSVEMRLLCPIPIFLVALVLVFIIKKIPVLKELVP